MGTFTRRLSLSLHELKKIVKPSKMENNATSIGEAIFRLAEVFAEIELDEEEDA